MSPRKEYIRRPFGSLGRREEFGSGPSRCSVTRLRDGQTFASIPGIHYTQGSDIPAAKRIQVALQMCRPECAFEAGLGVYGRSGLILHPRLGNRMSIGTILTDAEIEPDGRLNDFEPCVDCDLCIRKCPAQAFDADKMYPDSWSRSKCTSKRSEIASRGLYCHNCFAVCPTEGLNDKELLSIKESIDFHRPSRRKSGKTKTTRVGLFLRSLILNNKNGRKA